VGKRGDNEIEIEDESVGEVVLCRAIARSNRKRRKRDRACRTDEHTH
jgi:hypothetical protein